MWDAEIITRFGGSYFKYRGEGSQIFLDCFGGAVGQGVVRGVVSCVCGRGSQIQGGLSGRVSSEVSPDVCMAEGSQMQKCRMCVWARVRRSRGWLSGLRWSHVYMGECSQIQGELLGRVSCQVSFDVCMGECTQIFWIPFGGQQVSSM